MLGAAERSVLPFLASVFESVTPRAPLRRRHEVESVLNNFRYHCFAISSYPKLLLRYQFHSGVMGAVVTLRPNKMLQLQTPQVQLLCTCSSR